MKTLIKALALVTNAALPKTPSLKHSGNIKNRIKDYTVDRLIEVSDAFIKKQELRPDAFALGVDYGKVAKQKPGYLIEFPVGWVAFIGTENDILQRIDEYESKMASTPGA